jgi:hypothetical protein
MSIQPKHVFQTFFVRPKPAVWKQDTFCDIPPKWNLYENTVHARTGNFRMELDMNTIQN